MCRTQVFVEGASDAIALETLADRRGIDLAAENACAPDLETELIRAVGTDRMLEVIAGAGELDSFRRMQSQPAHRDRALELQMHRFIGTRSGRKFRYARLLMERLDLTSVPQPLDAVLTVVVTPARGAAPRSIVRRSPE